MSGFLSVLSQAQQWVTQRLQTGELAIDATAGNGLDTLFLAQTVGEKGQVVTFDIQKAALNKTQQKLKNTRSKPLAPVTFLQAGHETMSKHLSEYEGQVGAIMFNLGFLPHSDSLVVTKSTTTLAGLQDALRWLRKNGILTIVLYPGHRGGKEECEAVSTWAHLLPLSVAQVVVYQLPQKPDSAYLIGIIKK